MMLLYKVINYIFIHSFVGEENRITFQEVYSKIFKCEYQLQLYPFDSQVNKKVFLQKYFSYSKKGEKNINIFAELSISILYQSMLTVCTGVYCTDYGQGT